MRPLVLDVRLSFPELKEDSYDNHSAVPPLFPHLFVGKPGGSPFVRLRLSAVWRDDRTIDGEIEQKLCWVLSESDTPSESDLRNCEPYERGLIQIHYVPASRDPSSQLKFATSAMAGRLLRAIAWSEQTQQTVQEASEQIREAFSRELVIQTFNQSLVERWGNLHDDSVDADPEFNITSKCLEEEIRRVSVMFQPTELGDQRELEALSDGQKSLFYFSLAAAVFDVERDLVQKGNENHSTDDKDLHQRTGFYLERLQAPQLTIFAVEEPENHLAPYFLTRIVQQMRSLVESYSAQTILTSHSSAVFGRIQPSEVRHFRLDYQSRCAYVNEIQLPESSEEAAKYIREAVIAYPELYFARFVILGEGDSEQVVLPRLASAMGLELDRSFVAIVPLAGRHVNHFWQLLNDLDIPHATLLDLDQGRQGAGWGRIKYICKQLLLMGAKDHELLTCLDKAGNKFSISTENLEKLHTRDENDKELKSWIRHLESFKVFFLDHSIWIWQCSHLFMMRINQ